MRSYYARKTNIRRVGSRLRNLHSPTVWLNYPELEIRIRVLVYVAHSGDELFWSSRLICGSAFTEAPKITDAHGLAARPEDTFKPEAFLLLS